MLFLISFALVLAICFLLAKPIKKYPYVFYILAAVLSAVGYFVEVRELPEFVREYLAPLMTNCILGTALWSVVMWTGALPNGSKAIKTLMPIRGELSITAAILTIAHILRYGQTYLNTISNGRGTNTEFIISVIVAALLVLIMTPLTVISVKKIRKKMNAKLWKNIQRLAYGFYFLTYAHIIVTSLSKVKASAMRGDMSKYFDIICYSIVFVGYLVFRIRKEYVKRRKPQTKKVINSVSTAAAAVCIATAAALTFPYSAVRDNPVQVDSGTVRSNAETQASAVQESLVSETVSELSSDEVSEQSTEVSQNSEDNAAESQTSVKSSESSAENSKNSDSSKQTSENSKQNSDSQSSSQNSQTSQNSQNPTSSTVQNSNVNNTQNQNSVQSQQNNNSVTSVPSSQNNQTSQVQSQSNNNNSNNSSNSNNNNNNNNSNSNNNTTVSNPSQTSQVSQQTQTSSQQQTVPQTSVQPQQPVTSTAPAEPSKPESAAPPEPVNKIYNDGTYTASAFGYAADIQVSVTISGDKITSITVSSYDEDPDYLDTAKAKVISPILSSQSADVDAVCGATYSAKGILDAVQKALDSARI